MGIRMKTFTKKEWAKQQYKDKYLDFHGDRPDLKGKWTTLDYDPKHGTVLLIESVHFQIV